MNKNNLYSYQEVISAIYYDVIEIMGEDGIDAKLTAYDLLAVMAAPCTRLDYDSTPSAKCTPLMTAVHALITRNKRITSLTHQAFVSELNRSFLPTLSEERQKELLRSFRMVMGFDADGYAVFDKKYYDVYKGNMDKGHYTKIQYRSFGMQSGSNGLPDKEILKTYHLQEKDGHLLLDLEISKEDWIDILRGASPKAMQMIGAFSELEDHSATITEIEDKFGINKDSLNGVTAGLGNRAKRIMGIEVIGLEGKNVCWALPFNHGRNEKGRGFVWELRPEVDEAYRFLTSK